MGVLLNCSYNRCITHNITPTCDQAVEAHADVPLLWTSEERAEALRGTELDGTIDRCFDLARILANR